MLQWVWEWTSVLMIPTWGNIPVYGHGLYYKTEYLRNLRTHHKMKTTQNYIYYISVWLEFMTLFLFHFKYIYFIFIL